MKPYGFSLRAGLKTGLILAIVSIFLILTGMVEAFADREMLGAGTLGMLILFSLVALPGIMAANRVSKSYTLRAERAPAAELLLAGLAAGAVVGLGIAILILLLDKFDLRSVFVNATPDLLEILTFGVPATQAMLLWIVGGGILGLLGAAFRLAPHRVQMVVTLLLIAWILLSLLEIPFILFLLGLVILGGLTQRYGVNIQVLSSEPGSSRRKKMIFLVALVAGWVLLLVIGPALLGDYWSRVLGFVGLYAMLGLGLNIVVGYAGLLDLGYVAFFAIGAYTMGLLTSPASALGTELNFWVALPLSMLMAGFAGVLLGVPVLRMRGDYLAIVTLGFGEIIRILLLSDLMKPLTGGPQGILEVPAPSLFGFSFIKPLHFYYLIILGCLLVAFVSARLSYARIGRAWMAMREDEDVAEAMGVNLVNYKLLAFATGAAFAGISGGIFASWQHAIFPADFSLFVSINVLVLIIIGGIGSIPGVILGAAVLVGLPEVLREIQDYRILVYGALLVIMMIVKPEGLWPSQRRKLEMHEGDETVAASVSPASSG